MNDLIRLIIQTIACFLCIVSLAYIGLQRGVIQALREELLKVNGKNRTSKQSRPDNSCRVLHETAVLERQLYGRIMSGSIEAHMKQCPITYSAIEHKNPTRVDNCAHEYKESGRRMDGARYLSCEYCGHTRLVKYRDGGPTGLSTAGGTTDQAFAPTEKEGGEALIPPVYKLIDVNSHRLT